jgi:preprotein translocase subunit SecY
MKDAVKKLQLLFKDPELKRKTIFTLFIFTVFRIFAFLPVPSIDLIKLRALFAQNQFLSLLIYSLAARFCDVSWLKSIHQCLHRHSAFLILFPANNSQKEANMATRLITHVSDLP